MVRREEIDMSELEYRNYIDNLVEKLTSNGIRIDTNNFREKVLLVSNLLEVNKVLQTSNSSSKLSFVPYTPTYREIKEQVVRRGVENTIEDAFKERLHLLFEEDRQNTNSNEEQNEGVSSSPFKNSFLSRLTNFSSSSEGEEEEDEDVPWASEEQNYEEDEDDEVPWEDESEKELQSLNEDDDEIPWEENSNLLEEEEDEIPWEDDSNSSDDGDETPWEDDSNSSDDDEIPWEDEDEEEIPWNDNSEDDDDEETPWEGESDEEETPWNGDLDEEEEAPWSEDDGEEEEIPWNELDSEEDEEETPWEDEEDEETPWEDEEDEDDEETPWEDEEDEETPWSEEDDEEETPWSEDDEDDDDLPWNEEDDDEEPYEEEEDEETPWEEGSEDWGNSGGNEILGGEQSAPNQTQVNQGIPNRVLSVQQDSIGNRTQIPKSGDDETMDALEKGVSKALGFVNRKIKPNNN